jgi:hypothetical protein
MDVRVALLSVVLTLTLLVSRVIAYAGALFPRKPKKRNDEWQRNLGHLSNGLALQRDFRTDAPIGTGVLPPWIALLGEQARFRQQVSDTGDAKNRALRRLISHLGEEVAIGSMSFEGLSRIGQISIPGHDLGASAEFYRNCLGMNYLFQAPNMAFFDCGGTHLLLTVPEYPAFGHPSSIVSFTVDDSHIGTDALRDRGVEFSGNPESTLVKEAWLGKKAARRRSTVSTNSQE